MIPPSRALWCALLVVGLAACGSLNPTPITPTATRALSGPTLEPSPTTDVHPIQVTMAEDDIIGGFGQNIPEAAALVPDSALPPVPEGTPGTVPGAQRVQLVMIDGSVRTADLYEYSPPVGSPAGARVPGVLLIGAGFGDWADFPARLRDAGYSVLVVDSGADAAIATADFIVLLRALSELRSVNPGALGVIGVRAGADAALIGCAVEFLCDTAILISPTDRESVLSAIASYNPRPLLVSFSTQDLAGVAIARDLELTTTGPFQIAPVSAAGAGAELLFAAPALTGDIGLWLAAHLAGSG